MKHKSKAFKIYFYITSIIAIFLFAVFLYLAYIGIPVGSGNTSSLNCGGLTVNGDYFYLVIGSPFGFNSVHKVNLTVWSISLPPYDFDVYVLTHDQFISGRFPLNGGGVGYPHYLYKWDLSYLWNSSRGSYYLSKNLYLRNGDYIVISNDYVHIFQGVYGKAYYRLTDYM